MNSTQLADKVVLISGGARGLGAAFGNWVLARGGRVVLADVLDDPGRSLADELGSAARYVHLDVTDPAQWTQAVAHATAEFGRLDGLVNNAGVSTGQFIEREPVDHFRAVLEVNLVGVFNGIQAVIPTMRSGAADRSSISPPPQVFSGLHSPRVTVRRSGGARSDQGRRGRAGR